MLCTFCWGDLRKGLDDPKLVIEQRVQIVIVVWLGFHNINDCKIMEYSNPIVKCHCRYRRRFLVGFRLTDAARRSS